VTDLGYIRTRSSFTLRRTDLLLLESNHRRGDLKVRAVPWPVNQPHHEPQWPPLQRRGPASSSGSELDSSTTTLVLGHLSEHNNYPALVRLCAEQALAGAHCSPAGDRRTRAAHGGLRVLTMIPAIHPARNGPHLERREQIPRLLEWSWRLRGAGRTGGDPGPGRARIAEYAASMSRASWRSRRKSSTT